MDRERLQKIRNFQSTDWYPALFIRPLSILIMLAIADWKLLTPNRLTTIANLTKLGFCAVLVWWPDRIITAVVLLNLGILFDHLDGTMARYRRTFTKLGSFYDKVSDMVTWFLIMAAVGWAAARAHGDVMYLLLAIGAGFAGDAMGYMKWLSVAEGERLRWLEARADPAAEVAKRTAPIRVAPPPERTRADWIRWFLRSSWQIVRFEEMDLFFWVSLGLVVHRLDLLVWLLFITQTAILLAMFVRRGLEVARLDRRMRELGD